MSTLITLPTGTAVDAHGNPMSGGPEAIAAYDQALDQFLRYAAAVEPCFARLVEHHSDAPMTYVLGAYLFLTSTDPGALDDVRGFAAALEGLPKNPRERAHALVIDRWLAGDWHGAAKTMDALLTTWPTDLIAVQVGQLLDFAVGDARNLRDRIGRSLGALDPSHPHHGFLLGMQSFGLEECGTYDAALDAGMAALAANPDDVWATHAVAHVHEMRGDVERGVAFMTDTSEHWAEDNFFTVHLWWHLALYQLELGRVDEVLQIHDTRVERGAAGTPLDKVDATALLWRLHLDGVDVTERFATTADSWGPAADASSWYAFNDAHMAMALCGAGRVAEARQVEERLVRDLDDGGASSSNGSMIAAAGLPATRAVIAFAEGRHDDVVAHLLPVRRELIAFGGSNAQRDVIERTLVDAAIRSGQVDLARALLRERRAVRPTNDFADHRSDWLAQRS